MIFAFILEDLDTDFHISMDYLLVMHRPYIPLMLDFRADEHFTRDYCFELYHVIATSRSKQPTVWFS